MLRLSRTLLALTLAGGCLQVHAQFIASKITFRNPGPYTQAELQQTCMLLTGEHTGTPGIAAAAQRLMDTGYFDDVKVDTKGTREALEVIFILKANPPGHSTPVGFENFVWLTPEELQTAIHKAAPLFRGELPDAGNQPEAINAALQAALAAKGISAKVAHETLEPSTSQPMRAIEYRAEPPVRVGTVKLDGVPPELAAAEDKISQRLADSAYNEGLAGDTTASTLLAPSRNAGYLQATLTGLQRTVTPAGRVDLIATLNTGPVYHVAKITYSAPEWSNGVSPLDEAMTSDKMRTVTLHPGDIASRQRLLLLMQPLDEAYKNSGYMDVYVTPGETLDTTAHTVTYHLGVVTGELYHLRSVTPIGLSPAAQAEFSKAWRMKAGDVYNPAYVSHFIQNNSAMRSLATYTATFQASADTNTHLVDLTMKFAPSGAPTRR